MKLLGVQLRTPTLKNGIAAIGVAAALTAGMAVLNLMAGVPLQRLSWVYSACLAGALSAAVGVSVMRDGWRALVIIAALALLLTALFEAIV